MSGPMNRGGLKPSLKVLPLINGPELVHSFILFFLGSESHKGGVKINCRGVETGREAITVSTMFVYSLKKDKVIKSKYKKGHVLSYYLSC